MLQNASQSLFLLPTFRSTSGDIQLSAATLHIQRVRLLSVVAGTRALPNACCLLPFNFYLNQRSLQADFFQLKRLNECTPFCMWLAQASFIALTFGIADFWVGFLHVRVGVHISAGKRLSCAGFWLTYPLTLHFVYLYSGTLAGIGLTHFT